MKQTGRHALTIEAGNEFPQAQRGFAPILTGHCLRRALQCVEQSRGDNPGAWLRGHLDCIVHAQVVKPRARVGVHLNKGAARINQLPDMQRIDNALELRRPQT